MPPEYTIQYIKSELSSLSQRPKQRIMEVSGEGKQISSEQQDDDKCANRPTEIQPSNKMEPADKRTQQCVIPKLVNFKH
jgi:hypothetical protein